MSTKNACTKRSARLAKSNSSGHHSRSKCFPPATPAKKKKKTASPFDRYFGTQKEWLGHHPEVLYTELIIGIPGEEFEHDSSKYTMKQMNALRYIMVTQNRSDQLDQMEKVVLGDQANHSFLTFTTSFALEVLDTWDVVTAKLARKTPDQKLDILLAYTIVLKTHDSWMYDNEGGMYVLVKGLASAWKKLLKNNSDDSLGWDLEYTKPAVLSLLALFKSSIEGYDSCYGLGNFNFE